VTFDAAGFDVERSRANYFTDWLTGLSHTYYGDQG